MEDIIKILHEGNYSCVIKNTGLRTFSQRGIADLFGLLQYEPEFLKGSSVADKVIGKAAAAIMISGKVKELYANVISQAAIDLLEKSEIKISFGKIVPFIENRDKTGWCPMEKLCYEEKSTETILPLIEGFITKMKTS